MGQGTRLNDVTPFQVRISDQALADLQTRLENSRWIQDVFESDWRYGTPPPFVQSLCEHWQNSFDWRSLEARINREPQIVTEVDELKLHSVHRRSSRHDAIAVILIHGWPGAFLEYLDLCEPLCEAPADEPAFHVIIPSLPGYGFSASRPGVTPQRIASLFVTLMDRLGYQRFIIQGGNWGSLIGTEIARQFPERVIGLHLSSISGSQPTGRDDLPISEEETFLDHRLCEFPALCIALAKTSERCPCA